MNERATSGPGNPIEESGRGAGYLARSGAGRAGRLWPQRPAQARREVPAAGDPLHGRLIRALVILAVILCATVLVELLRPARDTIRKPPARAIASDGPREGLAASR